MQKKVLTPRECGELIPHWPEINPKKLERLKRMMTKYSKFYEGIRILVMGATPILTTEEGYIINGKHRALWAYHKGYNLENYVISDAKDILFHTPHKAFGEVGLEGALHTFCYKDHYIEGCHNLGVYSVEDLYVNNGHLFHNHSQILLNTHPQENIL